MEDPSTTKVYIQLFTLLLLTFINAFFACTEMAVASINRNKIKILSETSNDKKAKQILKLLDDPTEFLSTIQVGITLAGFLASASAATSFSDDLAIYLEKMNLPYSEVLAVSFVTIILAYFTLILGELVPKKIALQKPELIARATVNTILLFSKLLAPFVWLLTKSTNFILFIFRIDSKKVYEEVSEEEIRLMLEQGKMSGSVEEMERDMINSVFEFNDKLAKDIMVSRVDVFAVDIQKDPQDIIKLILEMKYTRIPFYDTNIDNVIGVLNIKDLIEKIVVEGFDSTKINFKELLTKPFFVPEHKKIDQLFKELTKCKKYMAILVDEYGGFSGIVTVEDLVEEIMGEIEDEYDEARNEILEIITENRFLVDGGISLYDLEEYLDISIQSENNSTLSGYIIERIEKIPDETVIDERIEEKDFTLIIREVKENRIKKVEVEITK
nr:hemolysin family protein [uncultured Cetobacterium sp.]